jgi:hypothetical protein
MARTTRNDDSGGEGGSSLPPGFRVKNGNGGASDEAVRSDEQLDGSNVENREPPNGTGGTESGEIDPAAIAGEPTKKRRGRPPGSGRKSEDGSESKGPSKGKLDLTLLRDQILVAHQLAAVTLQCPELALTEEEGKRLATALNDVAKQFDVGKVVNPKVQAILALTTVAAITYVPRAPAIAKAMKTRKAPKSDIRSPDGNVYPFETGS